MARGGARPGAGRPTGQGRFKEKTKPVRIPESMVCEVFDFVNGGGRALPLYTATVQAGFPSPADDHLEQRLDLNTHLIKRPEATFLVKARGHSMIGAGIHCGDILVVDRSLEAKDGKVVIAVLDGQLTVKRLKKKGSKVSLVSENADFSPIEVQEGSDLQIWGVVTNVLHSL